MAVGGGSVRKNLPFTRHGCGWCEVGQGGEAPRLVGLYFRAMEILPSYCIFRDYIFCLGHEIRIPIKQPRFNGK